MRKAPILEYIAHSDFFAQDVTKHGLKTRATIMPSDKDTTDFLFSAHVEPSPHLRLRVLRAVNEELESTRPSFVRKNGWPSYSAGLAAAILIGANLSIIAASVTHFVSASVHGGDEVKVPGPHARSAGITTVSDETEPTPLALRPVNLPWMPDIPTTPPPLEGYDVQRSLQ